MSQGCHRLPRRTGSCSAPLSFSVTVKAASVRSGSRGLTRRTAQPKLSAVIADARHLLRDCGPLSAYDYLRGDTARIVPHLGPAFFTKLLYFADASGTVLILDNQLARIVHRLSGMDHLVKRYGRSECWLCVRERCEGPSAAGPRRSPGTQAGTGEPMLISRLGVPLLCVCEVFQHLRAMRAGTALHGAA